MATNSPVVSSLWLWWSQVFNWWGLAIALFVFLPLGVAAGYNVRQPSLTSAATLELLGDTQDLRKFLLQSETTQAKNLDDKVKALDGATSDLRGKFDKLTAGHQPTTSSQRIDAVSAASAALRRAVDDQNLAYYRRLSDDLTRLDKIERRLQIQVDDSKDWQSIVYDQFKRFLKWIGALSFMSFLAATLFILILSNPKWRRVFAKTGTISAFGISFNFSDLQSVRASVQARQSDIDRDVKEIYTRVLRDSGVWPQFLKVMNDVKIQFLKVGVDLDQLQYRSTLFIPGFVGQDLVQAVRYDGNHNVGDESKVGRPFSVRFGIIGRTWRLQCCQYYPDVVNINNNLVRDWGFTREEAKPLTQTAAGGHNGSLMAFPVNDVGDAPPLGVIYIEADGSNKLNRSDWPTPLTIAGADPSGMSSADRFAAEEIWDKVDAAVKDRLRRRLARLQSLMRWNDKIEKGDGR